MRQPSSKALTQIKIKHSDVHSVLTFTYVYRKIIWTQFRTIHTTVTQIYVYFISLQLTYSLCSSGLIGYGKKKKKLQMFYRKIDFLDIRSNNILKKCTCSWSNFHPVTKCLVWIISTCFQTSINSFKYELIKSWKIFTMRMPLRKPFVKHNVYSECSNIKQCFLLFLYTVEWGKNIHFYSILLFHSSLVEIILPLKIWILNL